MSEYLRQFIHVFFGSAIIVSLILFGRTTAIVLATTGLAFSTVLSIAILKNIKIPLINRFIEQTQRKNEHAFPAFGAITFFIGTLAVLLFFEKFPVQTGAMAILTYGDGFSTIIGTAIGKIKLTKKHTLEGTIGGMLASLVVLASFMDWFSALTASTIAMLAELLPINDNITIPITAAVVLSLIL